MKWKDIDEAVVATLVVGVSLIAFIVFVGWRGLSALA